VHDANFINVIEIHGNYDPVAEFSTGASPDVKAIRLLKNDEDYTVAEIKVGGKFLLIAQCNKEFNSLKNHAVHNGTTTINCTGPYTVL